MNPNRWMDHARAFFFFFFFFLCLTAAAHGADHSLAGRCKANEREALLKFKNDNFDFEGRMLSSWDEEQEEDCCRWRGVSCHNTTGHILGLHLPGVLPPTDYSNPDSSYYYLEGNIGTDTSLLELKFLEYLDLSRNSLNFLSFVESVGSLKNLKHVNLSSANMFFGCNQAPHWSLGNLSKLEVLDLSTDGSFCSWGSCEWISHLSSLKYLSMRKAGLLEATNLFQALNTLPYLSYLDLHGSNPVQFRPAASSGSTPQFLNFSMLKYLDLSDNQMEFKPHHWIGNVKSLEYLDLGSNVLLDDGGGFLLRNLSRLQALNLSSTRISSNLEDFLSGMRDGVVESLDLSFTSITGYIPEWIGTWGSLRELDLRGNYLSGPIPKSIGNMRSLEHLNLSSNSLNGSIPSSIGNLGSLKELWLSDNNLNGSIPRSIGNLGSLNVLSFGRNWLSGSIPSSIGNLGSLNVLSFSRNWLTGSIPWSIGNLGSLKELWLADNNLNGSIPWSIGNLGSLKELWLGNNNLTGVVAELHLSNLSKLVNLDLRGNSVQLNVSLEWVPPFNLSELFISGCILQGQQFPRWIRTQKRLRYLSMADSCISGGLPQWIWNFSSSLYDLNLSSNMITGAIPGPVANPSLSSIDLSSNKLQGSLPRFTNNTRLTKLNLSNNSLSGHILLDGVSDLQMLDLSMNSFSDKLPLSLCNATQLVVLYLSYNQLSGPLPNCICASKNDTGIIDLRLNNNHLNGTFPQFLQNCSYIVNLDLGENRLSGEIPDWIAENMWSLRVLRLASNRFNGTIPPNLCNLTNLKILDLSHNHLLGSIPSFFGGFAAMKTKAYSNNDEFSYLDMFNIADKPLKLLIKGLLQDYTAQLKHVRNMDLSGNHLCGQIPSELGDLVGLQNLNLSNNHLSGNIPSSLGNLLVLDSLDLSRNKLSGGIPRALGELSFMGIFNVSYNNLSGLIPANGKFDTYPNTSYIGNPGLCGSPLSRSCNPPSPQNPDAASPNTSNNDMFWFLLGLAPGFVFGFWIFLGPLLLITRWRYAYFRFLDDACDNYLRPYLFIF